MRLPLSLWEFYGFSTGLISDLLSYLRLFALGLASGLLGNSFNQIAFSLLKNESGEWDIGTGPLAGAIFILVFGHGLNFGLALLGATVHSMRLNFVEFYKQLKFDGGGKEYNPFRKTETENM